MVGRLPRAASHAVDPNTISMLQAAPGRSSKAQGPYKEAIVFMVGGGNYLEYESLITWAGRATPPKSIVYGASDLLTGSEFAEQLAELGRRSGV